MTLSVYFSTATLAGEQAEVVANAFAAWGVHYLTIMWEVEESDVFLRLWTKEAETCEQMYEETALLRQMQHDDPASGPRQIIDMRFTPTIPSDAELVGARIIQAEASPRPVWLAQLADALGLTITHGEPAAPVLQRDSRFLWRRRLGATMAGVARHGSTLIVATYQGTLACDARDGSLLWQNPDVVVGGVGRVQPPAVVGNTCYIACCQEWLYALDVATGQVRWQAAAGGTIQCTPAIADGLVFVTAHDGYVYAFDAASGAQRWQCKTGPQATSWSSPIVHDGVVFTGSTGSAIFALRASDGAMLWQRLTAGTVMESVFLAAGVLYVAPACSSLYAMNALDGTLRWEQILGTRHATAPIAMTGELLILEGTFERTLQARHAHDGSLAWTTELDGSLFSAARCTDDTVYVATNTTLYARNARDGAPRWQYNLPGEAQRGSAGTPLLIDQQVVFCAPDGYLYALRAALSQEQ